MTWNPENKLLTRIFIIIIIIIIYLHYTFFYINYFLDEKILAILAISDDSTVTCWSRNRRWKLFLVEPAAAQSVAKDGLVVAPLVAVVVRGEGRGDRWKFAAIRRVLIDSAISCGFMKKLGSVTTGFDRSLLDWKRRWFNNNGELLKY